MTIHIGISGWRYAGWRGVFYPKGLAQARELAYASRARLCAPKQHHRKPLKVERRGIPRPTQ